MHHVKSRVQRRHRPLIWLLLTALVMPFLPGDAASVPWDNADAALCSQLDNLAFNGTLANESVQWQVSLGPRIPESTASQEFRDTITTDLAAKGWIITQTVHERHGMNLTNVEARWVSSEPQYGQVVLSAHYDSRNIADRDLNETNQTLPVPGANDGASGTAVLLEMARHIPNMSLPYDVVLFWNDAEDQNSNYTVGAEAWAENLSETEVATTESFVLLDMVGDADLQLQNIMPGNDTLKQRIIRLGQSLGMVNGSADCNGAVGSDIIQYDVKVHVLDDHVHPHELNIPSIDIMDPVYGEEKTWSFGTLWHTMEDTPDKVSAESLGSVGQLVELGLRTNAFVGIIEPSSQTETNEGEGTEVNQSEGAEVEPSSSDDNSGSPRLTLLASVALGTVLLGLIFAEWKLRP
jgi:glutaminyl-peptide cyclotransferase